MPSKSGIWRCDSPMGGTCDVFHRSEQAALRHCKRLERKNGHWYLPHSLDCKSMIGGTAYPCDCGSRDRSRMRKRIKENRCARCRGLGYIEGSWGPTCPTCQGKGHTFKGAL